MDDKTCIKILSNHVLFNPDIYVHSLSKVILELANCDDCEWLERWMRVFSINYITSISSASIYKFNNRNSNVTLSNISNLQINSKYLETSPIIVYDIILSLISLFNNDTRPKYHDLLSHESLRCFLEKYFRIKEKISPVKLSLIELKAYYNLSQVAEYSSPNSSLSSLILFLIVENLNSLNQISNYWRCFDFLIQIKYSMIVIINIIQASPEMILQISVHFTFFFNILLGLITSTLKEDNSTFDMLDANDANRSSSSSSSSNNNNSSDLHQPDRGDHEINEKSIQCIEIICDLLILCINQHLETCQFISLTDTISLLATSNSIHILQLTLCIIQAYLQQKDSTSKKSNSSSVTNYTESSIIKTGNKSITVTNAATSTTSNSSTVSGTTAARSRTGSINEENSNSRRSSKLYAQSNNSNRIRGGSSTNNESQSSAAVSSTSNSIRKVSGKESQTITSTAAFSSMASANPSMKYGQVGITKSDNTQHSQKLSNPKQTLLALSSSGKVRCIVESLMHRKSVIRHMACNILQLCQNLSKTHPIATKSRNPSLSSASHFWSIALIEQGLVPLLEIVVCGIPIKVTSSNNTTSSDKSKMGTLPTVNNNINKVFPEMKIRTLSEDILNDIIEQLISNKLLRQKCVTALTQSGNSKLRLNVLISILYLCGRSVELGRWLWYGNDSNDNVSRTIFDGGQTFMQVISLSASESQSSHLKHIIGVIRHFFSNALIIYNNQTQEKEQELLQQQQKGHSQLTGNAKAGSLKDRLTGGPTVAVMETFNDNLSLVKMQCPVPAVISQHSTELADKLQMILQTQEKQSNSGVQSTTVQGLNSSIHSPPIRYSNDEIEDLHSLPRLTQGSYNAWQEIFSHMVDDYLLDSVAHQFDANMLCELFELSSLFRLQKLRNKYANLLINKITVDNIPKLFKLSIGILTTTTNETSRQVLGSKDKNTSTLSPVNIIQTSLYPITNIQLALCLACLEKLENETELMFPRRNFPRLQELLSSLCRCLGLIILK